MSKENKTIDGGTLFVNNSNYLSIMQNQPSFLHIYTMGLEVKLPLDNVMTPTTEIYDKAVNLIGDLIKIDGVIEVLEKYGAEIAPKQ
jgi:hypothetical protein